jgi:hypothetical protein
MTLLEFAITTTAAQYILGASKLTATWRIRLIATQRRADGLAAPQRWRVILHDLLECSRCSGYWLGILLASVGPWRDLPWYWMLGMSGSAGLVLTAIGRSLMDLAVVDE